MTVFTPQASFPTFGPAAWSESRKEEFAVVEFNREQRLQIMLTEEELQAIDDWRFTRRMPTRAAAVRELLKRGLAAEGFAEAKAGEKSQHFGVLKPNGSGQDGDRSDDQGSL